ncbi:MAG: hypothetical protein Q7S34_00525 [bacterium]|nr:hypothetical protein [bacterium]
MLGFEEIIYNYMESARQPEFEKLPKKETEDNSITDVSAIAGKSLKSHESSNDAYNPRLSTDLLEWPEKTGADKLWPAPLDDLYPPAESESPQTKRKLLKGINKKQRDKIISMGLATSQSETIYLLEGRSKEEKQLIAEGIIYGDEILAGSPQIYTYSIHFPEYGRSLLSFLGKARKFENNLESTIKEHFHTEHDSLNIKDYARDLYRRQIREAIQKSAIIIDRLYDQDLDVGDEHNVYEDNVTTDYISAGYYTERGEPVPEYLAYAEKLIDPDSKYLTAKPQEKHLVILKKIDVEIEALSKEVSQINLTIFLFLSTFKSLKKSGYDVSLEDIKGVEFSSFSPEQFKDVDRETMRKIYAENYVKTPKLQNVLVKSFDEAMADISGKQRFYVFKHEGVVKGFYRLEETAPGHLYFGAFNIDSNYKGYRLGEAVFSESLDYEADLANIEADCDRQAPISCFYIENGFIGTDIYDFEEAKALHIIRNDELHSLLFESTDYSHDNIKKIAKVGAIVEEKGGKIKIAAFPASEIESIPFPQQTQAESDGSRYVLTRYFRDKTEAGEIAYAVLEKISGEDFKRFVDRANPYPPGKKTRFEEGGDYHIV